VNRFYHAKPEEESVKQYRSLCWTVLIEFAHLVDFFGVPIDRLFEKIGMGRRSTRFEDLVRSAGRRQSLRLVGIPPFRRI
jgi:hypothetical protein